MAKIFLSYARKEQAFAEQLRQVLLSWGDEPWMDVHDLQAGNDDKWWEQIDRALQAAEIVVGLMSALAIDSRPVNNEWDWALTAKRKLILMRLGQINAEKLSHRFTGLQYIDFGRDEAIGFDRLREVVQNPGATHGLSDVADSLLAQAREKPRARTTEQINRERMLQRVHGYWIEGVLRQAVNESNRFNVGYGLAPDAVVQNVDYSDAELAADSDFGKVFRHVGAEILILGAPGSGKTILLLQLTEYLLRAASDDDRQSMPIVLNLSSWSPQFKTLSDWIIREAYLSYQVPQQAIQKWLDDGVLIPLLDGLDEVLLENRDACVEAINAFRQSNRGVELAVCSRIADYNLLKTKLELRSAILLQPLEEKQVDAVITRPDLAGLKAIWDKEPWLREMALVPFLLNVMSYAYAGRTEPSLRLPANETGEEARRDHLLDTYITRRLGDTRDTRTDSAQKIRAQLSWLAARMQQRGQSVFHFESLQLDWVASLAGRATYCYLSRMGFLAEVLPLLMIVSVVAVALNHSKGIVLILSFVLWLLPTYYLAAMTAAIQVWGRSTSREQPLKDFSQLVLVFLASMAPSFIFTLYYPRGIGIHLWALAFLPWALTFINGILLVVLSCRKSLGWPVLAYAFSGFSIGFLASLVAFTTDRSQDFILFGLGGVQMVAMCAMAGYGERIETADAFQWKGKWGTLLIFALASLFIAFLSLSFTGISFMALAFGVGFGLLLVIPMGLKRNSLIQLRRNPSEGINRSIRMGLIVASLMGIVSFGIAAELMRYIYHSQFHLHSGELWDIALFIGFVFAIIGASIGGLDVFAKYTALRIVLYAWEKIPWRLGKFLDGCVDCLLLRRVGGGYIFVHRYLLEYFAKMNVEKKGRTGGI